MWENKELALRRAIAMIRGGAPFDPTIKAVAYVLGGNITASEIEQLSKEVAAMLNNMVSTTGNREYERNAR